MAWQRRLVWIAAPVSVTTIVLYVLHPQSLSGRPGWWFCLVLGISFALYCWRNTLKSKLGHMTKVLDNVPTLGTGLVFGKVVDLPEFTPLEELADGAGSEGVHESTVASGNGNNGAKV